MMKIQNNFRESQAQSTQRLTEDRSSRSEVRKRNADFKIKMKNADRNFNHTPASDDSIQIINKTQSTRGKTSKLSAVQKKKAST
jgi:hypothetical protein